MFQEITVLRKLQRIASGKGKKLFPNQVCFYNAIFGMTNPDVFPMELICYMETVGSQEAEGREKHAVDDFLRNGLDNSSSNIGKHINDEPGMAIPKHHCIHYARNENRTELCRRLAAVVRYYSSSEKQIQELLRQMKTELEETSDILTKTEDADSGLLGVILYEIVQTHLGERHDPNIPKEETVFGKINMKQQLEEYYLTCDCYEFTSIDYFFALERMAGRNVIASSNLAGFYYVGTEFIVKHEDGGPSGRYLVERNLEKAAFYFHQAASSDPPYAPAAYSYGYMILHGETGAFAKKQRMQEAERYYRLAADRKFHHAVSGLGDLALLRANAILQEGEHETERDALVAELTAAMEYFNQAQEMGSFWGPIKAARLLDDSRYQPYMKEILAGAGLPAGDNARDRWKAAVDMGNVYAMEQLALLDLRLGYADEAKGLLEHGSKMNYPNASWYLATRFYGEDGREPDSVQYRRMLEKASADGSAKASILLASLSEKDGNGHAELWLKKAEEQNLQCFDEHVYKELQKYNRRK